jgi:hypothetical protein
VDAVQLDQVGGQPERLGVGVGVAERAGVGEERDVERQRASGVSGQPSRAASRATRTPTDAASGSQTKTSPNGRPLAW